jgi:ceramide glucosyltransferase
MSYTYFTIRYRNGIRPVPEGKTYPFVSILKPLKNMDDEIEKNLESLFVLDYPGYEILLGVDAMGDPIVTVIKNLMARYPHIDARIIETGHNGIENPKIHKLALMEAEAGGSLFWANDSNIRAEKDTLKRLVNEYLTSGAKLIFSPIRAVGGRTMGSIIENAYINHFLSGNVISAWKMAKQQIIVGKSMLVERDTLARFGGFSYFKDYLAEDYMMGETYTQSKYPITSHFTWVTTVNQTTTVAGFFSRMERWAKLRFHLKPHFYVLEILLNPIMIALIAGLQLWNTQGAAVFAGSVLLKLALEYLNFFFINTRDRKRLSIILALPFCIVLKDLLLFAVYFTPFLSSTVRWRGGRISIGKKTLIAMSQESLLYEGA